MVGIFPSDPKFLRSVPKPAGAAASDIAKGQPVYIDGLPTGGGSVAWGDITGKPSTFAPTIGTTATTAAAGNHNHAIAADPGSGLVASPNLQVALVGLSMRIKLLEDKAA